MSSSRKTITLSLAVTLPRLLLIQIVGSSYLLTNGTNGI